MFSRILFDSTFISIGQVVYKNSSENYQRRKSQEHSWKIVMVGFVYFRNPIKSVNWFFILNRFHKFEDMFPVNKVFDNEL